MERKENKDKIIIAILMGIIIALVILVVLFATNIISIKQNTNNNDNNPLNSNNDANEPMDTNNYKEYKMYDDVTLSDGSKWMVIENSSKKQDYVTLLKKEKMEISRNNDEIYNELFETKTTYANSKLDKYVQTITSTIPVRLKEVNGYKIRLITVDEIIKLDNNWSYSQEHDSYTYTGKNYKDILFVGLTMTETKCTTGKCTSFYINTATNEIDGSHYYIEHWDSGLPTIKPVINVYKTELEK